MTDQELIEELRHQAKHNADEDLLKEAADRLEIYVKAMGAVQVLQEAALRSHDAYLKADAALARKQGRWTND